MKVVENSGLVKYFSGMPALDGVSFGIESGEITGLIGPNGAGKTTAIKVMLGLLRPESGTSLLFGEDPWSNPRVSSRIGVVAEKPHFPSGMKVGDYLSRVARIYGQPTARAKEDLGRVGLGDVSDKKIGKLSAGMLQKFALVHALINDPDLVLADEPTSNLDPQVRSEVLSLVVSLCKEKGTTFLISSHLLPELSKVCKNAVVISRGKIVASGNLDDLYRGFAADAVRVSTDKPDELASLIRALPYVISVVRAGDDVVVKPSPDSPGDQLYTDVPRLAGQANARLFGIESKNASLEELFRSAVSSDKPKGGSTN